MTEHIVGIGVVALREVPAPARIVEVLARVGDIGGNDLDITLVPRPVAVDDGAGRDALDDAVLIDGDRRDVAHGIAVRIEGADEFDAIERKFGIRGVDIARVQIVVHQTIGYGGRAVRSPVIGLLRLARRKRRNGKHRAERKRKQLFGLVHTSPRNKKDTRIVPRIAAFCNRNGKIFIFFCRGNGFFRPLRFYGLLMRLSHG